MEIYLFDSVKKSWWRGHRLQRSSHLKIDIVCYSTLCYDILGYLTCFSSYQIPWFSNENAQSDFNGSLAFQINEWFICFINQVRIYQPRKTTAFAEKQVDCMMSLRLNGHSKIPLKHQTSSSRRTTTPSIDGHTDSTCRMSSLVHLLNVFAFA